MKSRFCIKCDKEIKPIYDKYLKGISQPEQRLWDGGIVEKIVAGYGSRLDENQYIISICDDCIESNLDEYEEQPNSDLLLFKFKPTNQWINFNEKGTWILSDEKSKDKDYIFEFINEIMSDLKCSEDDIEIIYQ